MAEHQHLFITLFVASAFLLGSLSIMIFAIDDSRGFTPKRLDEIECRVERLEAMSPPLELCDD